MPSVSKKKGSGSPLRVLGLLHHVLVATTVQCADQLERCSYLLSLESGDSVQGILHDCVASCIKLMDEACRLLPTDKAKQLRLASEVLGLPHEGAARQTWTQEEHYVPPPPSPGSSEDDFYSAPSSPPSPRSNHGTDFMFEDRCFFGFSFKEEEEEREEGEEEGPLRGTKVCPLTEMYAVDAEKLTEEELTRGMTIVRNVLGDLKQQLALISDAEVKDIGQISLLAGLMLVNRARALTYPVLGGLTGIDLYARAVTTKQRLEEEQERKQGGQVTKKGSHPRGLLTGENGRKRLPWPELGVVVRDKAGHMLDRGDKDLLQYAATLAWGLPATGLVMSAAPLIFADYIARVAVDTGLGQGVTGAVEDMATIAQAGALFTKVGVSHCAQFSCREFDRMGGWEGCGKLTMGFVAGLARDPGGAAIACVDTVKMAGGAVDTVIHWTGQLVDCIKAARS